MTRKKETDTVVSQEDNAQVQHLLGQFHQIAGNLHGSSSQEEAEAVLSDINSMPEAGQLALLKALSKEHDSDAADVLIAINELSPDKSIRKEARRSLIRLEGAKVYPRWNPPVPHRPAVQIPTSNPPRFWKGLVTQAREEGEIELILCWEQGFEYSEVRMLIFIMDFWERGIKANGGVRPRTKNTVITCPRSISWCSMPGILVKTAALPSSTPIWSPTRLWPPLLLPGH